jgi:outer membrane protein assembly factor BamB
MGSESKAQSLTLVVCLLGAMPLAAAGSDHSRLVVMTDAGRSPADSLGGGPGPDWTNSGGNAGRNGLSAERGPEGPDLLWSGGRSSIIGWQPVTEGRRVFIVRQQGAPSLDEPGDSPIVALDLDTGAELWTADLPFNPGEWTTWIAGVKDGRVYASRSNTESMSAKLYALDAASGAILWASQDAIAAGLGDGVVFAPDGDAIVGESTSLRRVNSDDGATVWVSARQCWNHPSCGAAVFDDAIYVIELPGISRFDLATGVRQHSTTGTIGFGQTPLMVGADGAIYVARANNAPGENFFYAFEDSGTALAERWRVPVGPTFVSEFGIGPDGSVYMLGPGRTIDRLDPSTGKVLDQSMPLGTDPFLQPRIAIDSLGRVFVSNGSFDDGRVFAFDADLTPRWEVPVPRINIGGPALGRDGTLVVAGVGTDVRAYRTICVDEDGDEVCDAQDACPSSTLTPTVVIGTCDSGVPNQRFPDGCTFGDLIAQCFDGTTRRGTFVSCVARLTEEWRSQDLIADSEKGQIQRCAAHLQPRRDTLEQSGARRGSRSPVTIGIR